jgi:hypothetical protein
MKNELETTWQKAVNASFGVSLFPNLPGMSEKKNYGKSLNQNNHSTSQDLKTILAIQYKPGFKNNTCQLNKYFIHPYHLKLLDEKAKLYLYMP